MKTITYVCPMCHQTEERQTHEMHLPDRIMRHCPDCWSKRQSIDIENTDTPVCPVCLYWPNAMTAQEHDGEVIKCKCNRCGVEFTSTISVHISFCNEITEVTP